jgi:hypothetical protein
MSDSGQRKPALSGEHARLAGSSADMPGNWKAIGPYVSERAWGAVREDYSADGQAWQYFPYEHARSRAYRWNEDGSPAFATYRNDSVSRWPSGMGATRS